MKLKVSFETPLCIIVKEVQPVTMRPSFTITHDNIVVQGENMAETIQEGHIGSISVEWKDSVGNPAKVDGATTWASTDETVVTVVVSTGNPLIANWNTVGIGTAQLQATADADMGEGVKAVTSTVDFNVISGEAVGGVMTVTDLGPGTPSPGGGGGAPVATPRKR